MFPNTLGEGLRRIADRYSIWSTAHCRLRQRDAIRSILVPPLSSSIIHLHDSCFIPNLLKRRTERRGEAEVRRRNAIERAESLSRRRKPHFRPSRRLPPSTRQSTGEPTLHSILGAQAAQQSRLCSSSI